MLATRLVLIESPDQKSFHCYFVYTFCKDRIKTFLILILILSLIQGQRLLVPQVVALLQFILIIPAKNATSERSFSALLKSYLRNTTLQKHLNCLMLLDVHKKRTHVLDMQAVVTEFIDESEHRCGIFAAYIWAEWQWRRLMYNLTVIKVSWVIWVFLL